MSEKTGFKYRISFSQSITTGIIGFSGDVFFDDPSDRDRSELRKILQNQEIEFREAGYRLASDIEPKEKEVRK